MTEEKDPLKIALCHELLLCQESFNDFVNYAGLTIVDNPDKRAVIKMYSAYCDFLLHLYEFYTGIFELKSAEVREIIVESNIKFKYEFEQKDWLLNREAEKLSRNQFLSTPVNAGKEYSNTVPGNFGTHFRLVRNRTGHVLSKRTEKSEISLSEFHKQYHRFIVLLFQAASFSWTIKDPATFLWGEIEEFSVVTKKSLNK